jgi:HK97 family phage prohead protease
VILTVNHGHVGSGLPIARTTAGTLHLSEDHRGLLVNADLDPLDPEVQSLHRKMQRGDLDGQMSFAFRAIEQEWNKARTKRRIKVAEIHKGDVSIVNYGANDRTTSSIQGQDTRAGVPLEVRQRRVDVLGQRVSTGVAVLERTGTDCARCDGTGEITIRCPTCGGGEPPARSAPLVRPDYATENVLRLLAARGRSTAPARRGAKPLPVDWRAQYEALRKKAS